MDFSFAIAGFCVGFIVGMTGVGGGSLMTPILVLGFGIKPAIAVGTDLLYAAITKSAGIFVHQKHGNIQWRVVSPAYPWAVFLPHLLSITCYQTTRCCRYKL